MPVIGAVIVLSPEPSLRARALAALATEPSLTLGELHGARLPVVLETQSPREDRARFDALRELPGVLAAEPVYANFSDLLASPAEVST
jgi:nitrate reductase NapAB chaperone NapD